MEAAFRDDKCHEFYASFYQSLIERTAGRVLLKNRILVLLADKEDFTQYIVYIRN